MQNPKYEESAEKHRLEPSVSVLYEAYKLQWSPEVYRLLLVAI